MAKNEKWDVIAIGSGVGGLFSVALLGKIGKKVLVLEKHRVCGGACHTFNDHTDTNLTSEFVTVAKWVDPLTGKLCSTLSAMDKSNGRLSVVDFYIFL